MRRSSCSTAAARSGARRTPAVQRPGQPAGDLLHRLPPDNTIRAFRDEVLAAINVKNLIDVRSPDEFSGKILAPAHLPQEQSQRPGHIPGAINVPWSRAANEDGTFKSDEELAKLYADAGLDNSKETIAYCRIGERSSHTWFVLRELLGHQNVNIAFGYGPHACPASAYSRMCLTTFFTSLTQRFPQLQLARPFEDLERRGKGLHSVGIKELLVTWPT